MGKKTASATGLVLFVTLISFILKPAWEQYYKSKIAPKMKKFIDEDWPKINEQNLSLEHVQLIKHEKREIEVRFIGVKVQEKECFSSLKIFEGIKDARIEIESNKEVNRIVYKYFNEYKGYKIIRVEYLSRDVKHHV